MTLLAALARRYDQAAGRSGSVRGFGPAKIHYTAVLDRSGAIVAIDPSPREGKRLVREPMAPLAPPNRTSGVSSGAFWDKTSYVFGRRAIEPTQSPERQARDAARCAQEHEAFKARHETLLAQANDPGCLALLLFLRGWEPAHYDGLDHAADMLDQNIAFRLDGDVGFLHDRPAARAALTRETSERPGGDEGVCLVTGDPAPIARLHPSIKGVPGAQSSGASLVSFNLDAFNSYGRTQGLNAPVSEATAEAYGSALNALLTAEIGKDDEGRPRWSNRIGLGEDTVVFWAERPEADRILRGLLDPPAPPEGDGAAKGTNARVRRGVPSKPRVTENTETKQVRDILQRIEAGEPIEDATWDVRGDTKVYLLCLSPNAARLSVRFWREGSLEELAERFREHWADMRLDPPPPERQRRPPIWMMLYELAPLRKVDDGLRQLAGEWLRSIVSGDDYPASLLAQALMRVRAEHGASPLRVAIIKAVLSRRARLRWERTPRANRTETEWKDPWMALNREEAHVGYRLGRLFAVLESAQYAGLGRRVNAGVREKFFGSASATPRHVFPSLLRGFQDHLSAARKRNRGGRANRLDAEMREILGGLPSPGLFPAILEPDHQGAFVVGFYHQDAELRIPRAKDETIDTPETATEDETDGDA